MHTVFTQTHRNTQRRQSPKLRENEQNCGAPPPRPLPNPIANLSLKARGLSEEECVYIIPWRRNRTFFT